MKDLPRLAWCARVEAGRSEVTVFLGEAVERGPSSFVEGAWGGSFAEGRFDQDEVLLGSGARVTDRGLRFCTATHTLERLQSARVHDTLFISNSLPLLLAASGERCTTDHPFYDVDLISFVEGVRSARRQIPTRSGNRIRIHYCCSVDVSAQLGITERPKHPLRRDFRDYADYRGFLATLISAIAANASDPERQVPYRLLATVSSGYDSPACAVLAAEAGASLALTLATARGTDVADSGKAIGEHLGLVVHEFDRLAFKELPGFPEAEFLAVGTGGEDVVMAVFEPHLRDTVMVTGFLGDTVWSAAPPDLPAAREYRITYPAGASLSEFRLRTGFVHLPLPQVQHSLLSSIARVSRSEEMRPWRGETGYDRPIPTRILDEARVPRAWFGQEKKAVTQTFYHDERPEDQLSPESARDFALYHGALPRWGTPISRLRFAVLRRLDQVFMRFAWRFGHRSPLARPDWLRHGRKDVSANSFLFHWAVEKIRDRHRDALQ
jgi:hypothetical protein